MIASWLVFQRSVCHQLVCQYEPLLHHLASKFHQFRVVPTGSIYISSLNINTLGVVAVVPVLLPTGLRAQRATQHKTQVFCLCDKSCIDFFFICRFLTAPTNEFVGTTKFVYFI